MLVHLHFSPRSILMFLPIDKLFFVYFSAQGVTGLQGIDGIQGPPGIEVIICKVA